MGDKAVVDTENNEGYIVDIKQRKNSLIRPAVANVDNLIIVLSAHKPKPDFMLADKLILSAKLAGINPVICINKIECAKQNFVENIKDQYKFFDVCCVSAKEQLNIFELKKYIKGKISAFAGQSAVGKSSILNSIKSDAFLQTGGLSKKTQRGRHTTRQAELIYCEEFEGFIIDTPGFSVFEAIELDETDAKYFYDEFMPYNDKCRFNSCIHMDEPDCAVIDAVQKGEINKQRYERYLEIIKILKKRRENKYD